MIKKHTLVFIFLILFTQHVAAEICLPDGGPGNICSAKDFTLTEGSPPCTEGEIIPSDITLRIGMLPTANERYDIGIFVGDNANLPIGVPVVLLAHLLPWSPT